MDITMLVTILAMIGATVLAAWWFARPIPVADRLALDATPDTPISFGDHMSWFAVRARTPQDIADVLGVGHGEPANWRTGLACVHDQAHADRYVFISPPLHGWVFVVGPAIPMPPPTNAFQDRFSDVLSGLGREFQDVQYFATFSHIDYLAWVRYRNGHCVRAFAASEAGQIVNSGEMDRFEKKLSLKHFDVRGLDGRYGDVGGQLLMVPKPAQVFSLAENWSLDPRRIDKLKHIEEGVGIVAPVPARWRMKRKTLRNTSYETAAAA